MKRTIILLCLIGSCLGAGSIQNDRDFQQGVEKAGQEEKLLLMIYTAADCPECAYMKQKVFHTDEVELYMKSRFVVIEKDVHRSKLPDGFDYFGIPTLFFITKEGVKKEVVVGSQRPKPFLETLKRVWEKRG